MSPRVATRRPGKRSSAGPARPPAEIEGDDEDADDDRRQPEPDPGRVADHEALAAQDPEALAHPDQAGRDENYTSDGAGSIHQALSVSLLVWRAIDRVRPPRRLRS